MILAQVSLRVGGQEFFVSDNRSENSATYSFFFESTCVPVCAQIGMLGFGAMPAPFTSRPC